MQVVWRQTAIDDRSAIVAYLEPLNPYAAARLLEALLLAGDSLALFPYRGRLGLVAGTRELVAVTPYVLVYETAEASGTVSILRIWHAAQER
jgi:plasmid stabilization system protein ParE